MNRLLLLIFTLSTCQFLVAQSCTPINPVPLSLNCIDAPFLCCGELDGITGTLPDIPNAGAPHPLCPGTNATPNNIIWYKFVAGTENLTIEMNFQNCTVTDFGTGAQVGIYTDCTFLENIYCTDHDSIIGLHQIPLTNLISGKVYAVLLDGFAGSICDFQISVIAGSTMSQEPSSATVINGPSSVCNYSTTTFGSPLGNFSSTNIWTFSNPNVVWEENNSELTVTEWGLPNGGTIDLCVNAVNDCYNDPNGTIPICRTITVEPNEIDYLTGEFCEDMGGYTFPDNGYFYNEGMHQILLPNSSACDAVVILEVISLSIEEINLDIIVCPGESYVLNGASYTAPLIINSIDNGLATNGCPSYINLDLREINTSVEILSGSITNLNCDISSITLSASTVNSSQVTYSYDWSTTNGCIDGNMNSQNINVDCAGDYFLTVTMETTDDDGQVQCFSDEQSITITQSPGISLDFDATPISCMNDGAITVTAFGGSGIYQYNWNTGPTGPVITDLPIGIYTVTVSDDMNCFTVGSVEIEGEFDLATSSTMTNCDQESGTASVGIIGSVDNPIYLWSNGESTATINNLSSGWYSVTVTDDVSNCQNHKNVEVLLDPACYVRISGFVLIDDLDEDCVQDNSTTGANQVWVGLSNGQVQFTAMDGYYEFQTEAGIHEISIAPNPDIYENLCVDPITIDAALGNSYDDNIFYLKTNMATDLRVKVVKPNARPGFEQTVRICLMNVGNFPISGTLTFDHPELLEFISSSPIETSYDIDTKKLTWDFVDIPPGAVWIYRPKLKIPVGTAIGTVLDYNIQADPITGDINPLDNIESCSIMVTGSYDPNDKAVNPIGTGPDGTITPTDSMLSYTIRFQNTGNDTAFTVLLRDTLDENLNITKLVPGPGSHPYTASVTKENVLEFLFENIMLPDSFVNEPASNGFAIFDIHLKPDLPFGTRIENSAAIYFDFNEPIITNTVVNTLQMEVSLSEVVNSTIAISLIPNPASHSTSVQYVLSETQIVNISLYDPLGNVVKELKNGSKQGSGLHKLEVNTMDLSTGVYFVKIETENGLIGIERLVKM